MLQNIKEAIKAFAVWAGILRESVNGSYKVRNRWLTTFLIIGLVTWNFTQCSDFKVRCAEIQAKCDKNDSIKQMEIDKYKIQFYEEVKTLREDYRKLLDEKLKKQ